MYLFSLIQEPSLLLQDLFIKLRVKQEAAALSLRQRTAEVSETQLEVILRDPQLKETNTRSPITQHGDVCTVNITLEKGANVYKNTELQFLVIKSKSYLSSAILCLHPHI